LAHHVDDWIKSNVPVVCIVFDPRNDTLFWINASQVLKQARRKSATTKSIRIDADSILNEDTIARFQQEVQEYIAQSGSVHHVLTEMSGRVLDTTDYVSYFMNRHGEQIIFQQRRGDKLAWMIHRDLDWEPTPIDPELLYGKAFAAEYGVREMENLFEKMPIVGIGILVDKNELQWLRSCAEASEWWRDSQRTKLMEP
jgi:hypothetical protein